MDKSQGGIRKINPKAAYFSKKIQSALDIFEEYPIIEITAPMGFGKTFLLREYMKRCKKNLFYFKIRSADLALFWTEFCKRLLVREALYPKTEKQINDLIIEIGESLKDMFPCVIILDGIDLIVSEPLKDFLLSLSEALYDSVTIILSGRSAAWNHTSLPVIKGTVAAFFVDLFVAEPEDIESYYRQCGIVIDWQEALHIYEVSGGWYPLLHAHVLDCLRSGSHKQLNSFSNDLWASVYSEVSKFYDDTLLPLAHLDGFSLEQFHFICEREKYGFDEASTFILNNSYIYYTGDLYHIHNLLGHLLRERYTLLPKENQERYYHIAGEWYHNNADYYKAMEYFFHAGDFDSLLQSVVMLGQVGSSQEDLSIFTEIYHSCPKDCLCKYPFAILKFIERFYYFGVDELAEKMWPLFDESIRNGNYLQGEYNELMYSKWLCRALGAFNDETAITKCFRQAGTFIADRSSDNYLDIPVIYGSLMFFALFYKGGSMETALASIDEMIEAGNMVNNDRYAGLKSYARAEAYFLQCEWNKADVFLQKAVNECQTGGHWSTMIGILHMKAKLSMVSGNYAAINETLQQLQEMINQHCSQRSQIRQNVDLFNAYFKMKLGKEKEIVEWLRAGHFLSQQLYLSSLPIYYSSYNGILLAQGDYSKIIANEENLKSITSKYHWVIYDLYNTVQAAVAYKELGFREEAKNSIRSVLETAVPQSIYMPIIEFNVYIWDIVSDMMMKHYPQELPVLEQKVQDFNHSVDKMLYKGKNTQEMGLGQREFQIAEYAAKGLTNKEIASEMNISPNTVKAVLKGVFQKLEVNSRKEIREQLKRIARP